MSDGPYTTITVREYNRKEAIMRHLRRRLTTVRELLEKGDVADALAILKFEDDEGEHNAEPN